MMLKPIWWEYATFDDDGFVNGIKDNSPEEIKKEYEDYLKTKEKEVKI